MSDMYGSKGGLRPILCPNPGGELLLAGSLGGPNHPMKHSEESCEFILSENDVDSQHQGFSCSLAAIRGATLVWDRGVRAMAF